MFRWTASSLVAVFSRPRDAEKVRKEVADLNKTPLVHKIVLSGRTAVLTISPSHMVAEGSGSAPDLLVEQVDRFTLA
jgi:carotenoid cleavage dioxygenase-like enzyme